MVAHSVLGFISPRPLYRLTETPLAPRGDEEVDEVIEGFERGLGILPRARRRDDVDRFGVVLAGWLVLLVGARGLHDDGEGDVLDLTVGRP